MGDKKAIAEAFVHLGLVRRDCARPFVLKNGQTSDIYVDLRTLGAHPALRKQVVAALSNVIPPAIRDKVHHTGYVAGLPLGGVPLATLVAEYTELRYLMIRAHAKAHGTGRVVEAQLVRPTPVLLVDDVITSGSTVRDTIARFQQHSAPIDIVGMLCVVNRCVDAPAQVPGTSIPLFAVLTLADLQPIPRAPFCRRAQTAINPIAQMLFRAMERKKTNVCWSADVSSPQELLRLLPAIAPYIALVKVHFDAIPALSERHVTQLFRVARDHDVLVMDDRKFADIKSTVAKQLECYTAHAQCCTVHTIAGPGAIDALQANGTASVLVAEMSNAASEIDEDAELARSYGEKTRRLAEARRENVMGMVCQTRATCDAGDGFVYMTPGVHLDYTTDGADQRYRGCRSAVAEQRNDVVIVGRGIHQTPDPRAAAQRYRDAAWGAHSETCA